METKPISIISESNVAQEIKKTENSAVTETVQVSTTEESNLQAVQPAMTPHETGEQVTDKNLTDRQSAVVAVTDEKSTKTDEAVIAKETSDPKAVVSETAKPADPKETVVPEKTSELKEATQLPVDDKENSIKQEIEKRREAMEKRHRELQEMREKRHEAMEKRHRELQEMREKRRSELQEKRTASDGAVSEQNNRIRHDPFSRLRELIKMRQEATKVRTYPLTTAERKDTTVKTETSTSKPEN